MKRNVQRRAVVGVVVLALAAAARGEGGDGREWEPVYDVPRMEGVVVDGDGGDWGGAGYAVNVMTSVEGKALPPGDFDPRMRLAWDERGLLMLVTVRDDVAAEAKYAQDLWEKDSLEIFVGERRGSSRFCQVLAASGSRTGKGARCSFNARGLAWEGLGDRQLTAEAASRKGEAEDTSIIEMRLPWANLGIQPKAGDEVALQVFANDSDPRKPDPRNAAAVAGSDPEDEAERFRVVWYPSEGTDQDPRQMHRLRLSETAGGPVQAVAKARYTEDGNVRVAVTGTRELVGKSISVRDGKNTLTREKLREVDGRAAGQLLLKEPGEGRTLGTALEVFVEDEKAGVIELPADGLVVEALGEGEARVRLASTKAEFAKRPVSVEAVGLDGRVAGTATCALGRTVKFDLPDGCYVLRAEGRDIFGREFQVEDTLTLRLDAPENLRVAVQAAKARLAGANAETYGGWAEYLAERTLKSMASDGALGGATRRHLRELEEWAAKIAQEPAALSRVRGDQEWAYLSAVDGSGQPFWITVPASYDQARAYPLHVYLHGGGATHEPLKWHEPEHDQEVLLVRALGRGPVCGYQALGEVDVLDVMRYVKAHWHVDEERVHIFGDSMGGGGTWELAARHPDLFASARPIIAGGIEIPKRNLLDVPVRAHNGAEDWLVVLGNSTAAMKELADAGGMAIQEVAAGVGHGDNWDRARRARGSEWASQQVRARDVRRVCYTAMDEAARGAYWVEVVEWGPESRSATIDARLGQGNALYVDLDNVTTAKLDLTKAPVNRQAEMMVVIGQHVWGSVPSPLPDALYVSLTADGSWAVRAETPQLPAERLHFPGGAMNLFHGEPVMVVWGTGGDEAMNKRLYEIAQVARRVAWPDWEEGLAQMSFGELAGKADTEVTAEDMQRFNLLLIGTAEQNAVVAKLAERLPVKVQEGRVRTDDGLSWEFEGRAVGLLHYNPEAPKRLIYWVGSNEPDFYQPKAKLMEMQGPGAPDLTVTEAKGEVLVAARCLDSRWRWQAGYADSPALSQGQCTQGGQAALVANAMRTATGADLALVEADWESAEPAAAAGETRQADLLVMGEDRVCLMDLTGREILEAAKALEVEGKRGRWRFLPGPQEMRFEEGRVYRVAMRPWAIYDYERATRTHPASFRVTDVEMREALRRELERRR